MKKESILTLNSAWNLYTTAKKVGQARTEARERAYQEIFKPKFGSRSLLDFENKEIRFELARLQTELASKYAPSTLRVIMSGFKACMRYFDVDIKFPELPRVPKKSIQRVTQEQQEAIFKHIKAEYLDIIKWACLYGCRISEAINLKLRDFNFATMTFVFQNRKNKKELDLPIMPEAEKLLRQDQKVVSLDGYLFTIKGQKFSRQSVYRELQRAMKKAGVGPMPLKNFSRHSRACQLLEAGESTAIVARLLGDSENTVGQYYGEISSEKIRQVLSKTTMGLQNETMLEM